MSERKDWLFTTEKLRELFVDYYVWGVARNRLVVNAMRQVDRAQFVPPDMLPFAYQNEVIRLDHEEASISQPSLVAEMIDHLGLTGSERVLEVGTASGYNAALLSLCAREVHTVEINEGLALSARYRLESLGFHNVTVHLGDGAKGLEDYAPFDGIIVTAAARKMPEKLVDQLVPGGRLVIPIGEDDPHHSQLCLLEKLPDGEWKAKAIHDCGFFPMISDEEGGWTREDYARVNTAEVQLKVISKHFKISEDEVLEGLAEEFGVDPKNREAILKKLQEKINKSS